jgi:DNA damage-inducible protein 1
MKITINIESKDIFDEIEITENEQIETVKYIIEAEHSIPYVQQEIYHNGILIKNFEKTLKDLQIKDNDILLIRKKNESFNNNNNLINPNFNNINSNNNNRNMDLGSVFDNTMKMIKQNKANSNNTNMTNNKNIYNNGLLDGLFSNSSQYNRIKTEVNNLKSEYLNNPDQLNYLFSTNKDLAEAIVSGNDKKLEDIISERIKEYDLKKQKEYQEFIKLSNSDPNDLEAQKKIEEIIRLKNIEENMKMAHEYLPESFGHITMLFINLEINKEKITGLVDTGAQTTIISENLAKKCGLFNLCDTRYSGIAKGVGTSKILGVIHAANLKIGDR